MANALLFSRDIIANVGKLFARFGPLAGLVGGDLRRQPDLARWVFVSGAELNHEVTVRPNDFHKPPFLKQLSPRGEHLTDRQLALKHFGAGLFGMNGEDHKEQRRIMMPAFHKTQVEGYRTSMIQLADEELRRWQPNSVIDVRQTMQELTLRVATRCLLGPAATGGEAAVSDLIQRALNLVLSPFVILFPFDLPGFPYRRLLDIAVESEQEARRIIAGKRATAANDSDLLSMLLQAQTEDGQSLTDDQIVEHIGITFIAGHETGSNALTWLLLLLSQYPRVAADLLDELEGELHGDAPRIDQLDRLPFLDAVIQESMRVLPPVPFNARIAAHDTELGGYAVPRGTQVIISLFHTHRSPEVFERPNAFDPYRWATLKPAAYEFTPFGTGPRTCIGMAFAGMELKVLLAMIVQRFRLELRPGTAVNRAARITLNVAGSLPMRVNAQDRQFERGAQLMAGNVRHMLDRVAA